MSDAKMEPAIDRQRDAAHDGVVTALERWLPDPVDRRRVFWGTPARLFGFTP